MNSGRSTLDTFMILYYIFAGTVADNVRYGPLLRGKKLADNEVYKLLTLADLDSSFFNKNGRELSVGQAQRVALARTLANDPEVKAPRLLIPPLQLEFINNTPNWEKKTLIS